ncbi:MAG: MFS transporter [Alphaproteobacteria bacterium]|nr:MFS transporter [Alphaproteobacteria bacterium]
MQRTSLPFHLVMILSAISVIFFLLNIDYAAVNMVLLPVAHEINADLNDLQWLLSAYVLIWAALVIPASRLADTMGRRKALTLGMLIFMIGSALAGIGHSLSVIIAGRLLQGVGGALMTAPAWSLLFTSCPPERQGIIISIGLSFGGLGLATGPNLGGYIIEHFGWRWIFYINVPLGLLVILITLLYCPKDTIPHEKTRLNPIASFFLMAGVCLPFYALNQLEVWGPGEPRLWALFLGGLLFLGLYSWQDKYSATRLIPGHLFRSKAYIASVIGIGLMAISFSMILVLMGLYLQNILEYSSYQSGLIFMAMTLSMGLLSPIGGKLIDLVGVKTPMILGTLFAFVSFAFSAFLDKESNLWFVCLCLFLMGTGLGSFFAGCNIAVLRAAAPQDLSIASGVYTMIMMLGNTLSVILSTSLVVLWGRDTLFTKLQEEGIQLTGVQHEKLASLIAKADLPQDAFTGFDPHHIPTLFQGMQEAFVQGLSWNMMGGALVTLVALGVVLWGIPAGKPTEKIEAAPLPL